MPDLLPKRVFLFPMRLPGRSKPRLELLGTITSPHGERACLKADNTRKAETKDADRFLKTIEDT